MRTRGHLALTLLTICCLTCLHFQFCAGLQVPLTVKATQPSKRIAIVGAGTGGLGTLKVLLGDLPEELRRGWEIVVFEQRTEVGGIWLPDPDPPQPPVLPETPLYGSLMSNAPHPTMTLAHFPFPPGTSLFPPHPLILQYHLDIVQHWNLSSSIRLQHEVIAARWIDTRWRVSVYNYVLNVTVQEVFDHLIVASGHNHYPYEPAIEGKDEWVNAKGANHTVVHSVWFRRPEAFQGRNVVVVGGGASGRDIAQQILPYANSTYVSLKPVPPGDPHAPFPHIPGVERKPRIAHFTPFALVFTDDTMLTHIDTVVLATGYEYRVPFLTAGGHLPVSPSPSSSHLSTNLRRIHPLYEHTLSLDPAYPLGALYFVGLPIYVDNAIADAAQALFTAYTIAHPYLLAPRGEFLADLRADETAQRAAGLDPAHVGHRIVRRGGATAYQDKLVGYLQERGVGGSTGVPSGRLFTERWRAFGALYGDMMRDAWGLVVGRGKDCVHAWLEGVRTEEEWADMMVRLMEWYERDGGGRQAGCGGEVGMY